MPATKLPEFVGGSRLLTFKQTMELLQVHERTLFKWCAHKEIPSYKIGRNRKFKYDELMYWLEMRKRS